VLDQALDAIRVVPAVGEHRLGAANCEVMHERCGRPIGLDEGRYPVQRLCQRWILRDRYAGCSSHAADGGGGLGGGT